MTSCRICASTVDEFYDFGRQPLSDAFPPVGSEGQEFFFRLAVGICRSCLMVQLMEEVLREHMFNEDYPYFSSGSTVMRAHFEALAKRLVAKEVETDSPFVVELGSNDGVMLRTVADAGVPHLGIEPSSSVGEVARAQGIDVLTAFFEEETGKQVAAERGLADVVFSANTVCHIPYMDSIFAGLDALLKPQGIFMFEDPYWGDIVERASFDQIYDEHYYLFSATSVRNMARQFGFDLVDVERLPVHGGEVRYTVARQGARPVSDAVEALIAEETQRGLHEEATLTGFADRVTGIKNNLVTLLERLRSEGKKVVGYGATAKSATVANLCGLSTEVVEFVVDTTPAKQNRLTPGTHLPVRPPEAFSDPGYPDYALLFAWNHAEEITAKETNFRESGGRWILYLPDVHVV